MQTLRLCKRRVQGAGPKTDPTHEWGARIGVTGTVDIASGCWVYPFSHSTNGGSVWFEVGDVTIVAGSGINADGIGFWGDHETKEEFGPGAGKGRTGWYGSGAGYGGRGGDSLWEIGGLPYGMANAPMYPGSCGGAASAGPGSPGGGLVRIRARGDVTLNGTLSANGASKSSFQGAGSGGGIFVSCRTFTGGATAVLTADGLNSTDVNTGGGGGGRIAVWHGNVSHVHEQAIFDGRPPKRTMISPTLDGYTGWMSVAAGTGYISGTPAAPGTTVFLTVPPPAGTLMLLR